MKIAIFGGTGDLGRGLAICFAAAGHEIIVGSRSQERADQAAEGLREALRDERRAQAFYRAVMARHGAVRPFVNIVEAEARHEDAVASLMRRRGVADTGGDLGALPEVPGTLAACCALAASLERENIAMYDRLLPRVSDAEVQRLFGGLRDASKNNHLPAFERWSTRAGAGRGGPARS